MIVVNVTDNPKHWWPPAAHATVRRLVRHAAWRPCAGDGSGSAGGGRTAMAWRLLAPAGPAIEWTWHRQET